MEVLKKLIFVLATGFLAIGCDEALLPEEAPNDPRSNFENLWQTLNDKYSYFELKKVDWDSVYHAFSPRIDQQMSEEALFDELDSMLYLLEDGHVNLFAPFDLGRNWQWYLDHPDNFNYEVVQRHYLGAKHRISGGFQYRIWDSINIGYVYYGSFSSTTSKEQLDYLFQALATTDGLVLDLRSNGGGALNNAFNLAERFADRSRPVLISEEKTGPGPEDFGNRLIYNLSPYEGPRYQKPVILLLNRRSYSATNTFAAMMSNFDQVVLLGDTSGGGGGIPIDFELPNGWRYRFSATRFLSPSGNDIEQGVAPDIDFDLDPDLYAQGRDQLIERALDELR